MALQGDLSDLPLIDLMQVLTIQRRSGILTLIHSFSQAQIAFTQARVYSAFVWRVTNEGREIQCDGVPALHELMEWHDGQFTFELTNFLPPIENVKISLDLFVKDHYRLVNRQNLLEDVTAWGDLCPELVEQPPEYDGGKLTFEELRILRLINGILTIRDIAEMVRLDVPRVIGIVRELDRHGLIMIPRPDQPSQPLALPGTYQEYVQNRETAVAALPAGQTVQTHELESGAEQPGNATALLPAEAKPVAFPDPFARPAEIKPAPIVKKLGTNLPSFDAIESVLQALPLGPAWLNPAKPQPQPEPVSQPQYAVEESTASSEMQPVTIRKPEWGFPSLDFFNMPIESDGPITTPSQIAAPVVERYAPTPALAPKAPSRLQTVPVRWEEKEPVEEMLRPKVKRSLLGTIMAKIRGL